jgi:ribosomal protein S18 acetylase RimI-like enzyme
MIAFVMQPTIHYMAKPFLRSLHAVYETIASERRFFIRPCAPTRRALKQVVWDALKRNLPHYVAVSNQQVVGFSAIIFPTLDSLSHSGTLAMGVIPPYRRRGVGRALLETAIAHAFSTPAHQRVQLEVISDNHAAISLYKQLGFIIEGVAKQAVVQENGYKDIVHMALLRGA